MMGLNVEQFREHVLHPSLEQIGFWSEAAEMLLLGTAMVESRFHYLHQVRGPALGIYQIEPRTHEDIWDNYLKFKKELRRKVLAFLAPVPEAREQLVTNLAYATVMARVFYLRVREPLPAADDHQGLARYWKQHYNTELGAGVPEKFVELLGGIV